MAVTSTVTSTHIILSAEMKSDSFIDKKKSIFHIVKKKCFFSIKPKYIETAIGIKNSDKILF